MMEKYYFDFTGLDGDQYRIELMHFNNVPVKAMRQTQDKQGIYGMFSLLELICDEETMSMFDQMDMGTFTKCTDDWVMASKVTPGK